MATVRDTARRRPTEQAADNRRFTNAKASRAQCWQGQEVRVSSLGGGCLAHCPDTSVTLIWGSLSH